MTDLTPEQISGLRGIFTHWLETLDEEHSVEAPLYEGAIKALDMARECLRLRKELATAQERVQELEADLLPRPSRLIKTGCGKPPERTSCVMKGMCEDGCIVNKGLMEVSDETMDTQAIGVQVREPERGHRHLAGALWPCDRAREATAG